MAQKPYDILVNTALIGCKQSGKSQFVSRLAKDTYSEIYKMTIGAEFDTKTIKRGKTIKTLLWDLGSDQSFESIVCSQYVNGKGIIFICVDLSSSFEIQQKYLQKYLAEAEKYCNAATKVIVLGLKLDIQVCDEQMQDFCQQQELNFITCSAKTGNNVQQTLVRSLQIAGFIGGALQLPPRRFKSFENPAKIGFFGAENDVELLMSCFYEVGFRFVQRIQDGFVEAVRGREVYVCSTVDSREIRDAKCILLIGDQYQRIQVDVNIPVFVVNRAEGIEQTLNRILQVLE